MEHREQTELEHRLAVLEARLDALESRTEGPTGSTRGAPGGSEELPWVLNGLREREQFPDGSVIFAGEVVVGGRRALYQWQRPTQYLTDEPWDEHLERLAAITHPVRGAILRRLLAAPATAAELVEEAVVSSAGTAYHHLNALAGGGWISKDSGGRHSVRTSRIVALLTIIAAAEDH